MKENRLPTQQVNGEYIKDWLVIGLFFPDEPDMDFLAIVGGEEITKPHEGDSVVMQNAETLTWKNYSARENVINIWEAIGKNEYATAYAFCILQSETDEDALFQLESYGGIKIWINGKHIDYSYSRRENTFEAKLRAGENYLLVKTYNRTQYWQFSMRIWSLSSRRAAISGTVFDDLGKAIDHASVHLERDGKEIAQTMTDDSGSYHLNIYPVHGTYDLAAANQELGSWQLGIELDEGEHEDQNLILSESISIEGTILMLDDRTPHVAVPIQAIRDGEVTATTFSDIDGKYRFINLRPGRYQLRCQVLDGYLYYGKKETSEAQDNMGAEALPVEMGTILSNTDFRFAPFKKGSWSNFTTIDGLGHNVVTDIYLDTDGAIWFATDGGGVSRYDGDKIVTLTERDGLADNIVHCICGDSDGTIWFGTEGGASRYKDKVFTNFTAEDGLTHNCINDIYCDARGTIWFGTNDGITRYYGEHFASITTKYGLENSHVCAIHSDPDGFMWFGTIGGLYRYDGNEFQKFTTDHGLPYNYITGILDDRDGTMWISTGFWGGGGIARFDGKEFVSFTEEDGLIDNWVSDICFDPDGIMWLATRGGVSRYDGKTFVNFTEEDGLVNHWVRSAYCDPAGILWFGAGYTIPQIRGGVSRYDGKGFANYTVADGLTTNGILNGCSDTDGNIWFGTAWDGCHSYDGIKFVSFTEEDGIKHGAPSIHQSEDGTIWLGGG